MPRVKKLKHTYIVRKKPHLNMKYIDIEKDVPDVNIMMCEEIQEKCRLLLDILGHDIPLSCDKSDISYYYNNWYEKIAKAEKERHVHDS